MTPGEAFDRIVLFMTLTTASQVEGAGVHSLAASVRAEFSVTLRLALDHPEYARALYAAVSAQEHEHDRAVVAAIVARSPITIEAQP